MGNVGESSVRGDVGDPQRRPGRIREVMVGLFDAPTSYFAGERALMAGEDLVQRPYRDAQSPGGGGGAEVIVCQVFVDVVESGVEQAAMTSYAGGSRYGAIKRHGEQAAGVYREPCGGGRLQVVALVDGVQRMTHRGADAGYRGDPGGCPDRLFELCLQELAGYVQGQLLEVVAELEGERPGGVDDGDVAGVLNSGATVLSGQTNAAHLQVGVVAGSRRAGDVGYGPAYPLGLRVDSGEVEQAE
jgi:hypothetical protein